MRVLTCACMCVCTCATRRFKSGNLASSKLRSESWITGWVIWTEIWFRQRGLSETTRHGGLITLGVVVTFTVNRVFENKKQMRIVTTNESLFFGVVMGFNSATVPSWHFSLLRSWESCDVKKKVKVVRVPSIERTEVPKQDVNGQSDHAPRQSHATKHHIYDWSDRNDNFWVDRRSEKYQI